MVELEQEEIKHRYIFPNPLAMAMSKVDIRVQLEAGIMSMTFMMVGLIVTGVYIFLYVDFPLWYKIFLSLNLLAGLVFFISNLVTQYQQYLNYMDVLDYKAQEGNIKEV